MRKTKFIAICLSVCVANSLFGAEYKDNNETKLDGVGKCEWLFAGD
ncbi:hypothetical protein [Campylobacter concisus]|nr:hypothetical protein [Campylobacter concisus]